LHEKVKNSIVFFIYPKINKSIVPASECPPELRKSGKIKLEAALFASAFEKQPLPKCQVAKNGIRSAVA